MTLPDVVDLYIPQKEQTLRARVQWRHGDEIGLAFSTPSAPPAAQPAADEVAQRVAQLETEIASLRTRAQAAQERQSGTTIDGDASRRVRRLSAGLALRGRRALITIAAHCA